MYPNLYYFFNDFFGVEWHWLKMVNSFGFFVAIAFIMAAWVLSKELKRKQKEGLLTYTERTVTVGLPARRSELIIHFVIGFVFGYKILGAFFSDGSMDSPQQYLFSLEGNCWTGLLVGSILCYLKWKEKQKQQLPKPEKKIVHIYPVDRVSDIVVIAAIFGFSGAKLFDILESPTSFFTLLQRVASGQENISSLLFSGLTFYGSLICAGIAIIYYANRNKITLIHLLDACAPTMMLAYGVGRIGCQIAGDGDWGILNSAFVSDPTGQLVAVTPSQFSETLQTYTNLYTAEFGSLASVQHVALHPFWHLPEWFFAYNYPHNVIAQGVAIADCSGQYCTVLPIAVFPTPFYEIIMSLLLFGLLWALRKRVTIGGQLFAIYLFVNGLERFLIEKIRVNVQYSIFRMHPTQAEIISALLMLCGICLFVWLAKQKNKILLSQTK